MRLSISKRIVGLVVSLGGLLLTAPASADRGDHHHGSGGPEHPGGGLAVPEIPAKGIGAGLLLAIGGAAVIMGRRRKSS